MNYFPFSHGPHFGTIIGVHEDACVVRLDEPIPDDDGDGLSPSVVAVPFDELRLMNAVPDTGGMVGQYQPSAKVIGPATPVMIDLGDGNHDKPAVVLLGMPDYCVVRLDAPLQMGGSRHAAADWHMIRFPEPDSSGAEIAAAMDLEQQAE